MLTAGPLDLGTVPAFDLACEWNNAAISGVTQHFDLLSCT